MIGRPDAQLDAQGRTRVEFKLLYEGPLPTRARAKEKHAIRAALSPQLAELWSAEPILVEAKHNGLPPGKIVGNRIDRGAHAWGVHSAVPLGGFQLVPLVTRASGCSCLLDVLFLRPGSPGDLLQSGGDIDNRLKTLFDALRMPCNLPELGGARPATTDNELFCLVEDDALVTKVSIETGRLLRGGPKSHDLFVQVDVRVVAESAAFKQHVLLE